MKCLSERTLSRQLIQCVIPSVIGRCCNTIWILSSSEKVVSVACGDSDQNKFGLILSIVLSVLQVKGKFVKGII